MRINDTVQTPRVYKPAVNPFHVMADPFPPGVTPDPQMAMDDQSLSGMTSWASSRWAAMSTMFGIEGIPGFIGYPALAALVQKPENMTIVSTLADDMTRKWIEFKSAADKNDKSEKIAKIVDKMESLDVRGVFKDAVQKALTFGRMHIYPDLGTTDDKDELAKNVGEGGESAATTLKVGLGCLKDIRAIEPQWVSPGQYETSDPLKADWYSPRSWHVMSKLVHHSRLITLIPFPVSDMLKPAYFFGGLSLVQMARPYVEAWNETEKAVREIVKAFSIFVLKTDMSSVLQGEDGSNQVKRAEMFNRTRSNAGVMLIDHEKEDFANVQAPLSGLDRLQAQSQEHMASVARMPLVKLTGISPSGLNASSEGEIRVYFDGIHSMQEGLLGRPLRFVVDLVQFDLFGEVDPDITFEFVSLYELTEVEKAQVRQTEAQTGQVLIQGGVIDPAEERLRVAADPDTPYVDLDPNALPEPPPQPGEEDGLGGEDPLASTVVKAFSPEAGGSATVLPFLARDYSPSEARAPKGSGEGGQWTSGGSHTSRRTHSGSGASHRNLIDPVITQSGGGAQADTPEVRAAREKEIKTVAQSLGLDAATVFYGGPPPKVDFGLSQGEGAGRTIMAAETVDGVHYPRGSIILFGDGKRESYRQVMAHEAMHARWIVVMDRLKKEASTITDEMTDERGVLKPEYAQHYPIYALVSPYLGFSLGHNRAKGFPRQLADLWDDDGVSEYSHDHWVNYEQAMERAAKEHGGKGLPQPFLAINETLAEISRLDAAEGDSPEVRLDRDTLARRPLWRNLHTAMMEAYARIKGDAARTPAPVAAAE